MSYFIRVATPSDAPVVVPQYWEQQIVSPSQSNIYYTDGNIGAGIPNPLSRLAVDGGATFGASYYTTTAGDGNVFMSGACGIGTTNTSGTKLKINGNAWMTKNMLVGNDINASRYAVGGDLEYLQTAVVVSDANTASVDECVLLLQNGNGNNKVGLSLSCWNTHIGLVNIYNPTAMNYRFSVVADYYPRAIPTTAEIFTVLNNGNVGVGTTAPTHKLHVVGNTKIDGDLTVNGTTTTINAETIISDQLIINNAGTGSALIVDQTGAEPIVEFKDDGATVFKIVNGGSVGIGTTLPQEKLDVNGNAKVNGYIHIAPNTLTTPLKKGAIEYNEGLYEGNLFATTNTVNRGIITTEKLYVLNASQLKLNAVGAQQVFPSASIAVNANTTYRFKAQFYMTRTAGTVSHTISTGLTSTAVFGTGFHSVAYTVISTVLQGGATTMDFIATDALTVITQAVAVASEQNVFKFDGIIRIASAGFLNLVFSYSVAPGGAPTIQPNAYISLTPIGTFDATDIGS